MSRRRRLASFARVAAVPPPRRAIARIKREPFALESGVISTLDFTPPPFPSVRFYRGNGCGMRLPAGIPKIPGAAGFTIPGWNDPPVMTGFDFPHYWRRSKDELGELCTQYVAEGNSHIEISLGVLVELGFSLDELVAYAGFLNQYVPFIDAWALSDGAFRGRLDDGTWTECRDRDRDFWAPKLDPLFDALLANGLIHCACVGRQLDGANTMTPGPGGKYPNALLSIIQYMADKLRPHDVRIGTHWVNAEGGAWNDVVVKDDHGNDVHIVDRALWWDHQVKDLVQWFHVQLNCERVGGIGGTWKEPTAELQRHLGPEIFDFFASRPWAGATVYEPTWQAEFDNECTRLQAVQRGLGLLCAPARRPPDGYGFGPWQMNGEPL